MSGTPDWLPPLVLFHDHGGDWEVYLEALYACFRQDFIDAKPVFQGRRLGLRRHPMSYGKEATFWHMIQEGETEEERVPDFRRCERIRWPKPIIEHAGDPAIRVWRNERRGGERVCLWFVQESYLVVLAERGEYVLFLTAYLVEQQHRQRKLQKECEEYWKKQKS
jgi:hypothetical protein